MSKKPAPFSQPSLDFTPAPSETVASPAWQLGMLDTKNYQAESDNLLNDEGSQDVVEDVPFDIQNGWSWVSLGQVAELINGDRGKNYPSKDDRSLQGVPFINAGHLVSGTVDWLRMDFIPEAKFNILSNGKIHEKDILYCIRGSLGKLAQVIGVSKGAIASSLLIIRALNDRCLDRFIFYYLSSGLGISMIRKYDNGTAQPNLSAADVGKFAIPLPPLNEQRRIVAKIEELRERSRKAREALESIPPLLEQFRQSVLAAAFRGDLTADWRKANPNTEPASVLLDRIKLERRRRWEEANPKKRYLEPEPTNTPDLPGLPEGWVWIRIIDVGIVAGGKRLPPGSDYSETQTNYPYIRVSDFEDGTIKLKNLKYISESTQARISRYTIDERDVYISIAGTIGISGTVPSELGGANLTENAAKIMLGTSVSTRFLALVLQSEICRNQIEDLTISTTISKLGLFRIESIWIPLPSAREQDEVARKIDESWRLIKDLREQTQGWPIAQQDLDQAILAKAFRGELVPQDPADEPASVLLERIRAAREAEGGGKKPGKRGRPKKSG